MILYVRHCIWMHLRSVSSVYTSIGPETPFSTTHLLDRRSELGDQVLRRTNARLSSQSVLSEFSTDKYKFRAGYPHSYIQADILF